jgi:hypothetical protein
MKANIKHLNDAQMKQAHKLDMIIEDGIEGLARLGQQSRYLLGLEFARELGVNLQDGKWDLDWKNRMFLQSTKENDVSKEKDKE